MIQTLRNTKRIMAGLGLASVLTVSMAMPALAAESTNMEVGISAGAFTMDIGALTFADANLDYSLSEQTVTTDGEGGSPATLTVSDMTGSGADWTVYAESDGLSNGTDTIANSAITVTPSNLTTDDAATLGAGGALGTQQVVMSAAANDGNGVHTADLDIEITVPASQVPGMYTGTLTVTNTSDV